MASCADEWFRIQPNTPFGGIFRFDYPLDKQVVFENEICNPIDRIENNLEGLYNQKISSDINLVSTTQLISNLKYEPF